MQFVMLRQYSLQLNISGLLTCSSQGYFQTDMAVSANMSLYLWNGTRSWHGYSESL